MRAQAKLVDRVDKSFIAIAECSIRWRWLVAFITTLLIIIGLFYASKARFDNSMQSFFYKDDPAYAAYKEYLDDFVSDEVVYILYSAKRREHGPFDIQVMRAIAELTEVLAREVPFVREATSLANVEFMQSVGENDIEIDDLLREFPESQEELLKTKQLVLSKPLYVNYLVNAAADHAAIILQMEANSTDRLEDLMLDPALPADNSNLYPVVSNEKVREILARPEFAELGIAFYLSGDVVMNAAHMTVIVNDVIYITLAALATIVLLCMVMFRATLIGVLGPIAVVITSVILTVGLIGLLGWPITNFFSMLPTLICAVGVAQSVHILLEYQRQLSVHGDSEQAIKASLQKVGGPCLMAALTTAAGFAVMASSNLLMLAQFAVYSAFGILLTFVLSATLLVVFLAGKQTEKDAARKGKLAIAPMIMPLVEKCIALNLRYPKTILCVFASMFVISFLGMGKLRIDFNFLTEFKPHVQWRHDTEIVEREMGGTLRMSYLIETGVADGVKHPALMQRIERIQRFAERQPLVKKTLSLADILKDLNQTFHAGNSDYFRVPDQQALLAQYLLVYEMSGGKEIEEFVSQDFSRTVIELQVEMTDASRIQALLQKIDAFIEQDPFPDAQVRNTGIGLLMVNLAQYIGETQLRSYALVFAMIAIFMCISFGSIKVGLISMIPNLTPVVFALGALGWANVPIDYIKLLLATIAIGIAVDDTIHLVTRFRSRFYEIGNYQQALIHSLGDVGPALIVTSVILIFAFAAFLASNTVLLANFGILLGGTIAAALVADLLLMPVLLLKLQPFGPEFNTLPDLAGAAGSKNNTLQEA